MINTILIIGIIILFALACFAYFKRSEFITSGYAITGLILIFILSLIQFEEAKDVASAKKKARYAIELENYLDKNEPVITDDIFIKDLHVDYNGNLTLEVLIKDEVGYSDEIVKDFEESLGENESPYIEYTELKEDVVYLNKGKKITKLFLPNNYLKNNF